ncbi:MAG: SDR family NAD(P)-dependent oxidoreductase [Betaproteobacteria bacterium]|nr:MAG: SDR family NAD(P)-dependent oxidoreductase [Betaproteobacteria bacterium]TAG46828.1 MAG: SDR family NAD(P)-dependent oxidoreductase [Betaproteobacteria bacterium]
MSTLNPPIRDWPSQRVWIIGASTGIGKSLAEALLARGARVAVSARRADVLEQAFSAHTNALRLPLDLTDVDAVARGLDQVVSAWAAVDLVIIMAGTYSSIRAWELTAELVRETMQVNVYGVMNASALLTQHFLKQRTGHLSIVSSVAGYRGLPKALVYGPSKAAMINFAETLYIDLSEKGIGVSVVNPGFVRTPLTAGNKFNMPHLIEPEEAASQMIAGYERGEFEIHFPKAFTRQLKLLRLLPYRWYFKLIKKSTGL